MPLAVTLLLDLIHVVIKHNLIHLLSEHQTVPFSDVSGKKEELRLAGTLIGPNDTAIAGHAVAAGAILLTNNVREFERVLGLALEDWAR